MCMQMENVSIRTTFFNNKGGAEIAATTVNKELVANESWDYFMPSSTSMNWKVVLYIPS